MLTRTTDIDWRESDITVEASAPPLDASRPPSADERMGAS